MCPKDGLRVNLSLLPVKVTYFLLFAAIAVLLPYLPVYMKALGLTPAESAIILSVTTACTGVVRAIVGVIADRLRRHRLIIFICCLLGGIFHFGILFIPPTGSSVSADASNWNVCCCNSAFFLCDDAADEGPQDAAADSSHLVSRYCNFTHGVVLTEAIKKGHVHGRCVFQCCYSSQGSGVNDSMTLGVSKSQTSCHVVANFTVAPSTGNCLEGVPSCESQNFDLNGSVLAEEVCQQPGHANCSLACEGAAVLNQSVPKFQTTFFLVFLFFFLGQSAFSPVFNLLDGLVYVYLGDKYGEFGKQRLWGTVAFGCFALSSGFIMDALQQQTQGNSYLYAFIAFLVLISLTGSSVYFYKATPTSSTDGVKKNFRYLLCNFYLQVIYAVMLVAGALAGVLEAFFFWFLKTLGAGQSVFGVALLVSCILETIVLFFSGKMIARLGFSGCLYVVFAVFSLRFVANSFIENPWIAVVMEGSQCICFGLLYPTVTSWGSTLTLPGMHGTVQGVMGALYFSIGRAVGAALGGLFFETYGPRTMFRIFSVVSFVFLIILIILLETAKWRQRKAGGTEVKVEGGDDTVARQGALEERNHLPRDDTAEELLEVPVTEPLPGDGKPNDPNKEMVLLVSNNV